MYLLYERTSVRCFVFINNHAITPTKHHFDRSLFRPWHYSISSSLTHCGHILIFQFDQVFWRAVKRRRRVRRQFRRFHSACFWSLYIHSASVCSTWKSRSYWDRLERQCPSEVYCFHLRFRWTVLYCRRLECSSWRGQGQSRYTVKGWFFDHRF